MTTDPALKSRWHGFYNLAGLAKATLSLGGVLVVGLGAVFSFALDEMQQENDKRYVLKGELVAALDAIVVRIDDVSDHVDEAALARDCKEVVDELERLEDIIEYKRLSDEDHGLEDKLLGRAARDLSSLDQCKRKLQ